jgi:hypothetical protein
MRSLCPTPRKKKYRSQRAAGMAITDVRDRIKDASDLHAYKCDCGFWHVGHISKMFAFIERLPKGAPLIVSSR